MKKKLIAFLTASTMLFTMSISAYAAQYEFTHKNGTKTTPGEVIAQGKAGEILAQKQDYKIELKDGKQYNLADYLVALKDNPTFTEDQIIEKLNENATEELKVVSVSAINKTGITVLLNKEADTPLNKDFFKVTGATLINADQGLKKDTYVLTIDSLEGKKGTVSVNGVSKEYDFTIQKATVESVKIENYRQMKVTFTSLVDNESAVNPNNYYFEIVEGNAGKLGVKGDVTGSYRLADIDSIGTWWTTGKNIIAKDIDGKTVVTINLPYHARLGDKGIATDGNVLTLKALAGVGTDNKALSKGVTFDFAVRNVKDKDGKRSLDTSVTRLTVQDTKAPTLLSVKDMDGNVVDLSKEISLYNDDAQKLIFEFDEPILITNETSGSVDGLPHGAKAFVNNENAGADKNTLTVSDETGNYIPSKNIVLNMKNLIVTKANKTYNLGDKYQISLNGMKDLAGNLYTASLNFRIVLTQRSGSAIVQPQILGVEQIADNIFRVEANRENVTGVLTIKNAASDGADDVSAVMPLTKKVGSKYYSYVAVLAEDNGSAAGVLSYESQAFIIKKVTVSQVAALDKGADTDTNANIEAKGLDFNKEDMRIEKDTMKPELVGSSEIQVPYKAANDELKIPFVDRVPASWGQLDEVNEALWVKLRNQVVNNNTKAYVADNSRLKVDYVKADGTDLSKFADLKFGADATTYDNNTIAKLKVLTTDNKVDIRHNALSNNYDLSLDLGELSSGAVGLPADFLVAGALPAEATYVLDIPDALLGDSPLAEIKTQAQMDTNGISLSKSTSAFKDIGGALIVPASAANTPLTVTAYQTAFTAGTIAHLDALNDGDAAHKDAYAVAAVDNDGRDATAVDNCHGYTTVPYTITIKVGPNEAAAKDGVPQTAKELMLYDAATGELQIGITGAPTTESMKNLKNYLLNGQSLDLLGATEADITVADATAIGGIAIDKEVRIKLPKGSITSSAPANFTVQGLVNKDGGMMTPVTMIVEGLKDNTSPALLNAKISAARELTLSYNEPLTFVTGATKDSAAKNFEVKVNGTVVAVSEVKDPNNENDLVLTLGAGGLDTATSLTVEVKRNPNGKIEITDKEGNFLREELITVK